ncbi:hypothetical protein X975_18175, partial [Stegodyphus mimosarum]
MDVCKCIASVRHEGTLNMQRVEGPLESTFVCDVLFDRILRRMHAPQEKTQILWWFIETKSMRQKQRNCRRIYQKDPPSKSSILRWKKNFLETGSIADKKRSGRPCTSDFDVERVRETFLRNPRRSVRSAARELYMPISTVYKVIKKKLRLHEYKVQIVQVLEPDDRPRRMAFATDMLRRIEDDAEDEWGTRGSSLTRIMKLFESI